MNLKRWLLEREPEWAKLEGLLTRATPSPSRLPTKDLRELGLIYRSVVNDLSRVRSSPGYEHLVPYLNNLTQRAHALLYAQPPATLGDLAHFFAVSFPRCFRKNALVILLSFLTFVLGAVVSMTTIALDPETSEYFLPPAIIEQVRAGHLWMESTQANPSESSFLMTNNIRVAINAYTGGIFFGMGTLLIMFHNGMSAFGGPLQICLRYGMGDDLLLFMIPHGVIELTTIFIAGGAGMMVGGAMLFPGNRPRWDAVRERARESLVLIMGCFPLLVVAGLIEGMVSLNRDIPPSGRIAVALGTLVGLAVYLGFSGLERRKPIVPGNDGLSKNELGAATV